MVWLTVSRLIVLHPQHHPRPLLLALIWPLIRLLSAIKDLFGLSPSPYWLVKWMHSLGCDSFLYFIVVLHFFFQTNNETRNHGWGQDIDVCDIDVWSLHLVRSALSLPMVINTEPHYVHLYVGCVHWNDLLLIRFGHCRFKSDIMSRVSSCSWSRILSVIRTYIICFMFLKQKLLWIT